MGNLLGFRPRLPRSGRLLLLLACAAGFLLSAGAVVWAAQTSPAPTINPAYGLQVLRDANNQTWACYGNWSSGTDADGTQYMPCTTKILAVDRSAKLIASFAAPGGARRDVASNADGSVVYYIVGQVQVDCIKQTTINNYGPDIGSIRRAVRQANGSYAVDMTWKIPPINFNDTCDGVPTKWGFRGIDVDKAGNIFAAADAYVFIYSPTGVQIDAFGGDSSGPAAYNNGLDLAEGLSVTPDGSKVYVVEQRFNFVQRWDRQLNGTWVRSSFKIGTPWYTAGPVPAGANCTNSTWLNSPYDVDLDGAGNIYVLDVSCFRILKYTNEGTFIGTLWRRVPDGGNMDSSHHLHGMSVDFRGTFLMADPEYDDPDPDIPVEPNKRYLRIGANTANDTRCLPDWDAPTITSLTGTSPTGSPATLKIVATDSCSAIESMKITGDHTSSADWQSFNGAPSVTLSGFTGTKVLTVRVRDAAGRVSDPASVSLSYNGTVTPPPPPPPPPVKPNPVTPKQTIRSVISIYGPTKLCVKKPIAAFSKAAAKTLNVADSCARLNGKLLTTKQLKTGRVLTIKLSLATTKLLYKNATRAVTLQVAGTTRTRTFKRLRVGRNVTVTGAIIVARDKSWISLAPAGSWTGS